MMKSDIECFIVILLLMFSVSGCAGDPIRVYGSFALNLKPTPQEIDTIERNLKMPSGAYSFSSYVRYYAVEVIENRRFVVGMYVASSEITRIEIVDLNNMPMIMDGGCRVVHVRFSIESGKVDFLRCNGVS